jgi:hypothetical protein
MAQADAVQKLVGEFGAAAKAKLANPASTGQPEDQLRAPFEKLFTGLAALASVKDVTLVGETSLADLKTRPDYSVTAGKALIGFIEVKAPGKGANVKAIIYLANTVGLTHKVPVERNYQCPLFPAPSSTAKQPPSHTWSASSGPGRRSARIAAAPTV